VNWQGTKTEMSGPEVFMNKFLLFFSVAAIGLNAFGLERRIIESKSCDGKAMELAANEAILFDESQSIVGFKQDDSEGCAKADFFVLLLNSSTVANSDKVSVFQPVLAAGGKNCKNEMLPAASIFFESLTMKANSMELTKANGCGLLIMNFKSDAASPAPAAAPAAEPATAPAESDIQN
jgi:hypothetical protein